MGAGVESTTGAGVATSAEGEHMSNRTSGVQVHHVVTLETD